MPPKGWEEDLNDHDDLRTDPLLAAVVGKGDPTGKTRQRTRDRGKALAGKSTLNRLELTPAGADKHAPYKKVVCRTHDVERLFVSLFLQAHARPPEHIVLGLDATDDPVPGHQLGRFFHGYYKDFCYLPLYVFCGDHLLCARLRPADIDAAAGSVKHLRRIVAQVRQAWPGVKVTIRADSGFCREPITAWCEANGVGYVLGMAQNTRLKAMIAAEQEQARREFARTKEPARVFTDLRYRTLDSRGRERRVVAKAEHLAKEANPRFVVTSLAPEDRAAEHLYEEDYCGRGETENRIKEQQLHLLAERTSARTMRGNQVRLFFSSIAYVLLSALRRLGLAGTGLARARCQTIRSKSLKVGALVRVTVHKVWVRMSGGCPYGDGSRPFSTSRSLIRCTRPGSCHRRGALRTSRSQRTSRLRASPPLRPLGPRATATAPRSQRTKPRPPPPGTRTRYDLAGRRPHHRPDPLAPPIPRLATPPPGH